MMEIGVSFGSAEAFIQLRGYFFLKMDLLLYMFSALIFESLDIFIF